MTERSSPIAHAAQDESGAWRPPHDLAEHLVGVATLAADFAEKFGADWARLAGQWHDLGKYRPRFQKYIRQVSGFEADAHIENKPGRSPHSTAGALLACDTFNEAGRVLAYLIAGHHAGLDDWHSGLNERLSEAASREELDQALAENLPAHILDAGAFRPDISTMRIPGGGKGFALWVRMLFSCLVDADFLDTEAYMNPDKAAGREGWPGIPELLAQFDRHMAGLAAKSSPTPVNELRANVLAQCRAKAAEASGLFSLTVPTGGGKTLSSMAFALEHAITHSTKDRPKRRIIYVIPYTSIIEQTADIFRGIFGDAVIEHHSNAEVDPAKENHKSRLACENWDAPIVVTTNVQFFESLFAAKTSRCRKLHNIVDSVVVLDEAQLLPPEFLQPILDVLNLLTRHYGVTVVISTATQPALASRSYFDAKQNIDGLENVREIVADPDALYRALERVNVTLPTDMQTPTDWDTLAAELGACDSVLAIVNRRNDARELWQRMPEGTMHLSALMCGAHRSQVITSIKARLKAGISTRVISTQLVEAGVDVDFPVVYRALAGLDSIAQAAGRCNREGKLERGAVVVFVPPIGKLPDMVKKGVATSITVLYGLTESTLHPEGHAGFVSAKAPTTPLTRPLFARFFEQFYYACDLDKQQIRADLKMNGKLDRELAVDFRTAAEKFKLVQDEDRVPVVVRYCDPDCAEESVDGLIASLRKDKPPRWLMRKLQRYTVNIHSREALKLQEQGDIEELMPGLYVQVSSVLYHPVLGLLNGEAVSAIPASAWVVSK